MTKITNSNNENTYVNWARQSFDTVKSVMYGGRVDQTVQLTFTQSAAQSLNSFLNGKVVDSDVKASKAILFNMTTVTLVQTVALYLLGSMSFLGAAALIALSLVGRAIVIESFNPDIVELSIQDEESQEAYLKPESLYTLGIDWLYKMDPIVRIFSNNVEGRVFTNVGFSGIRLQEAL